MFFMNTFKMEAAIRNGDCDRVARLLRKGMSVNMVIGNNALIKLAVLENQPEVLDLLIRHGAILPPVDGFEKISLLHVASRRGYVDVAETLYRAWPHLVDARDNMNRTPLHDAARFGHADTVRTLLDLGAVPAALDSENRTAFYRAQEKHHDQAAACLKPYHRYPEVPAEGWYREGEDRILRISYEQKIGYRIADIFNFTAGERTRICQNMETSIESSETRSFLEMEDKRILKQAADEMKKRGVDIDLSRIDPFFKNKGP